MSETYSISNLPAAAYFWTKDTYVAETKLDGGDVNGSPLSCMYLFYTALDRIFAKIPLFSHCPETNMGSKPQPKPSKEKGVREG